MKIDFIKGHGTGNDFVIVDEISKDYNLSEENRISLAISVCNRENSIGADGLVFVQKSENYDGKMRIFNSDGTEPEMCGNALRCVSRMLLKKLNKKTAIVETMKAVYSVKEVEEVTNC